MYSKTGLFGRISTLRVDSRSWANMNDQNTNHYNLFKENDTAIPFEPYSWKLSNVPKPEWKLPKDQITGERKRLPEKYCVDPGPNNYNILTSGITPRPIALVSSVSSDEEVNLAPFSFFNVMLHDPPIFAIGISAGFDNEVKDTAKNLMDTRECVINMISEDFIQEANFCSIDVPPNQDEFELVGLHKVPSVIVSPPVVAESVFSIECAVVDVLDYKCEFNPAKTTPGRIFICKGLKFHIRKGSANNSGVIDMGIYQPVSRLAGPTYGRTTTGYMLKKPTKSCLQ